MLEVRSCATQPMSFGRILYLCHVHWSFDSHSLEGQPLVTVGYKGSHSSPSSGWGSPLGPQVTHCFSQVYRWSQFASVAFTEEKKIAKAASFSVLFAGELRFECCREWFYNLFTWPDFEMTALDKLSWYCVLAGTKQIYGCECTTLPSTTVLHLEGSSPCKWGRTRHCANQSGPLKWHAGGENEYRWTACSHAMCVSWTHIMTSPPPGNVGAVEVWVLAMLRPKVSM